MNELAYHVTCESKNVVSACYWLEWILEFDLTCKANNEKCVCEYRTFAPVDTKYQNDTVWIIWEVILHEAKKRPNKLVLEKILTALMEIFSIKYSAGVKRRRKYVIYFAMAILTEPVDFTVEIIQNKPKIDSIVKKIAIIYKDIKKNEISPEMDYLFHGLKEQSSFDKTIERLEKMNELMGEN